MTGSILIERIGPSASSLAAFQGLDYLVVSLSSAQCPVPNNVFYIGGHVGGGDVDVVELLVQF